MLRLTLLLPLLLTASAALAQDSTSETQPPETKAPWAVPVGPGEHRIELALEADERGSYAVRVAEAPSWLVLEEADAALAEGEGVIAVPFRVAAEALSGKAGTVRLEVVRGGAVVAESTFRVELEAPATFEVRAPYPNPSAGQAVRVAYLLPSDAAVALEVFDVLGRQVLRLEREDKAGAHVATLDVSRLAAGPYVLQVVSRTADTTDQHVARFTIAR